MGRPDQFNRSQNEYATLEARVTQVSEATIRKKWKKLPTTNHSAAREVIISAKQQSRRQRGKISIDIATADCVEEIASRLIDRLPRIPFPPATDENYFDHEANLNRIGKVEEQLSTNIHSMNLLRAQIAKEEQLLKQDEAEVARLEQGFKSNESIRRDQTRTLHPVARRLGHNNTNIDPLVLATINKDASQPLIAELLQDDDTRPTLQQLQNHLDSIQNNMFDIKEVKEAVKQVEFDLDDYMTTPRIKHRTRPAASGFLLTDQA